MKKIAIALCGSSGVDYLIKDHKFFMFRSTIIIDEQPFVDFVDIDAKTVYQKMTQNHLNIKSAQTPTADIVDVINQAKKQGYEEIIFITISSKLSGTIQGIYAAATMVEGIIVHPYDSRFVGYPLVVLAQYAEKMVGLGYSVEKIFSELDKVRDSLKLFFIVDSVKYLVRSGRLSLAKGLMASLLNIKPILTNELDGSLQLYKKVRAKTKAIRVMLDDFIALIDENTTPFIMYTDNYDEALELKKMILEGCSHLKDVAIYPLPPVIGVHAGPGGLAVGMLQIPK